MFFCDVSSCMTERDVESQTPTLDSTGSTRFYSCCEPNRRPLALHKKGRSSHSKGAFGVRTIFCAKPRQQRDGRLIDTPSWALTQSRKVPNFARHAPRVKLLKSND